MQRSTQVNTANGRRRPEAAERELEQRVGPIDGARTGRTRRWALRNVSRGAVRSEHATAEHCKAMRKLRIDPRPRTAKMSIERPRFPPKELEDDALLSRPEQGFPQEMDVAMNAPRFS